MFNRLGLNYTTIMLSQNLEVSSSGSAIHVATWFLDKNFNSFPLPLSGSFPLHLQVQDTEEFILQAGNINFRQHRPGAGKDRPISHPPVEMIMEEVPNLPPRHFRRRQTMPEMMLKEELAKMRPKGGKYVASYCALDRKISDSTCFYKILPRYFDYEKDVILILSP